MANINISDYTRPGIFIEEFNDSAYQVPAQTTLINLVVGFSKKGPVNKPILITDPKQFITIFGEIDRNLEKKFSYFHRTVLNMLSKSPVWALNLLNTDSVLDTIDYQSISIASDVSNSVVKKAPYDTFFNKSDFWERDTESFLTNANLHLDDNRQVLHITNMSDKKVSVFVFKANVNGYNDTLDMFYGGASKVPVYLSPKDQAKDYLVSMLIVAGDFSDYATLSVDSKYSKYFNKQGLIKSQIGNFSNDSSVSVLKYYTDLSIIPYFRNLDNRDIFIETVVNAETDNHGVFVSYDIDKVESVDYRTGLLDLLGSNLVGSDLEAINYLSYKETISEKMEYVEKVLNRAGNGFGRNTLFETNGIGSPMFDSPITRLGFDEIDLTGITEYVLNGKLVTGKDVTLTIPNVNIGKIRKDTVYLDDNGVVGVITGSEVSNYTLYDDVPLKAIKNGLLPIGIIGVGSTSGSVSNVGIFAATIIPNIGWEQTLTPPLDRGNVFYERTTPNTATFIFNYTKDSDLDVNYRKTKSLKLFNDLQTHLVSGKSITIGSPFSGFAKITLDNFVFQTDGSEDKSLTINVPSNLILEASNNIYIYYLNDSFSIKPSGGSYTHTLGLRTNPIASTSGSGYGTVSKESKFYKDFTNGLINSGDYFFPRLAKFEKVEFYKNSGDNFIKLWFKSTDTIDEARLFTNRKVQIYGSTVNDNTFTILGSSNTQSGVDTSGIYNSYIELVVNENVFAETVITSVDVCGASLQDKTYLKLYTIGSELYVDFTQDKSLVGTSSLTIADFDLSNIKVLTDVSSFKETLEIETIIDSNKILVDGTRYSDVVVGNYLQAYVDADTLQAGEVPRRYTRIIDKKAYPSNPLLSLITTDSAIDVLSFGDDKQTFKYTTMEDYVKTYKAITLGGFKIREDSKPNGTEQRQSDILDLISVNTPLFKGLVNRNKLSWRYLIDSFGLGLTGNSKQQLVDLCGARLTALGLLNMPSAKMFKHSTSPSFLDKSDNTLSTEFIKLGGDPASNPSFLYTLGQGVGQSNVAYFFPYVTISDNSRPLLVPPSSYVGNTFMNKHLSKLSSVHSWTVSAGITDGLVTGIGNVEIDLTPDDISNLNLMSVNPIVYKMNRGFCIETDNTAQLSPRSALSYIHVREVLIDLENELYEMLLTYQWKFNTAEIRAEIKKEADKICQRYVDANGLYAFLNVMDETNNTSELIDAQIGVLNTYVEPIKALQVIVNQITIKKTGSIAMTGFGA